MDCLKSHLEVALKSSQAHGIGCLSQTKSDLAPHTRWVPS